MEEMNPIIQLVQSHGNIDIYGYGENILIIKNWDKDNHMTTSSFSGDTKNMNTRMFNYIDTLLADVPTITTTEINYIEDIDVFKEWLNNEIENGNEYPNIINALKDYER